MQTRKEEEQLLDLLRSKEAQPISDWQQGMAFAVLEYRRKHGGENPKDGMTVSDVFRSLLKGEKDATKKNLLTEIAKDFGHFGTEGMDAIENASLADVIKTCPDEASLIDRIVQIPEFPYWSNDTTPSSLSKFVLSIAKENGLKGKITDITCGYGCFLSESVKFGFDTALGIEINKQSAKMAQMNIYVRGIKGTIANQNCFDYCWHNCHGDSSVVFGEFPWKLRINSRKERETMMNCNANRLPMNENNTTDYFFMSAMLSQLSDTGKAFAVVPGSTLVSLTDRDVRNYMVHQGYVESVIELPENLFYPRTGIKTYLVILSRGNNVVSFGDISNCTEPLSRHEIGIDLEKAMGVYKKMKSDYHAWRNDEDLAARDYSLMPSHYLNDISKAIPFAKPLIELADVFTGWQVTREKLEKIHRTDGTGTKMLQMSDVENGVIKEPLERYEIEPKTATRFRVLDGDVVISTKSQNVKSAVASLGEDDYVVASGSIMVIRPHKDVLNPYYLKAYFDSSVGKKSFAAYQTGVFIPNLTINNVKKIPVPAIDKSEQDALAKSYQDVNGLIQAEMKDLERLKAKSEGLLDKIWDKE